ncbi:hypothetical protein Tco_0800480 [Tanacetum coccineum]|uniref:Uncharacterized protein n=1 Tax=Tanacetum coccineum TaxID=301880 RepID=A0ABQ4ZU89_9ASTR
MYTTSIMKTNTARYEILGIEDMVPMLWSTIKHAYDKDAAKGIKYWGERQILGVKSVSVKKLHGYGHLEEVMVKRADQRLCKFKEGDFVDLHLNDIEDMLLLAIQHKLFHLNESDIIDFIVALRMFIRCLIIKRRVEDLQLGVESYQKKLNITTPQQTFPEIKFKELYTPSYKPPRVIYEDLAKQKRVMRADELYKFTEGTLKKVRDELHHRIIDFHLGYNDEMSRRKGTAIDKKRSELIVELIDKQMRESHHGPSDAMHNPSQPLKVSQKTLVSFLMEIKHISIEFLTPSKCGSSGANDEGFVEVKNKKPGANGTFPLSNSFEALNVENSVSEEAETGNKASPSSLLVDDDGKPLKKVDYSGDRDSEDEINFVDNEMTSYMASKPSGVGHGRCLKEKPSGSNFNDWFCSPKMVLRVKKKLFIIEQPISPASPTDSKYLCSEMRFMMLIMRRREYQLTKMKNYVAQLKCLGYVLSRDLSVGLIMNGLTSDFAGFVRNYNKHNMGKTIGELHALLIEYEKGKGKGKGKGKDKSYTPKPKNPKPYAKEHPKKDDTCHHCKDVGH